MGLTGSFGSIELAPDPGMQSVLLDIQGNVFSDLSVLKPVSSLAEFTVENATFLDLQGVFDPSGASLNQTARGQLTSLRAVPDPSTWFASCCSANVNSSPWP